MSNERKQWYIDIHSDGYYLYFFPSQKRLRIKGTERKVVETGKIVEITKCSEENLKV